MYTHDVYTMVDIFDHTILCKKCQKPLSKAVFTKNGFRMRALICSEGHEKILHPTDLEEYEKFKNLRQKEFKVKMRIVGNSYAVSIPKEIVSFMQEQEKLMNDVVRLCFEDTSRVSLNFENKGENKDE